MKDISIIFPAYNEIERIQPTLEAYNQQLSQMNVSYELFIVDDGSTDGTAAFLESLRIGMPNLRVIRYEQNRGKGNAVRVGMLNAISKIRVMADSDGSIPANQLEGLLRPILLGEADISIGSRYVEGAAFKKFLFFGLMMNEAKGIYPNYLKQ